MAEDATREWKVVRAIYDETDRGEYCKDDSVECHVTSVNPQAEPIGYRLGNEYFGSLEELCLKMETLGDDVELYMDMNDREVAKLCDLRRAMAGAGT